MVALLGPRQVGKTTLARLVAAERPTIWFDLESGPDRTRLENPELALGHLEGLVVLDEIQLEPSLFRTLRVLADRDASRRRFLILGSASPEVVRGASESLAGRVEFLDIAGFHLAEVSPSNWSRLWTRGGFPRSFLADSDDDSAAWREGFVRSFLERDLPQLGIRAPAAAMRRFWTMLAHLHGQTWNASELGRSMGMNDKTVRSHLDLLSGTFMVRQLQPWFENIAKRQVKAPKVYIRDSGLLHTLLSIPGTNALLGHPRVGASWEGFVIEEVLRILGPVDAWFWGTHAGAELDLFLHYRGHRFGIEVKFREAPSVTRSMHVALADLKLDHLLAIHPGRQGAVADDPGPYPLAERITALPLHEIDRLPRLLDELCQR